MSDTLFDDLPAQPLTEWQRTALRLLAAENGGGASIAFFGGARGRNPIMDTINRGYDELVTLGYALKRDGNYYITDAGNRALKRKATK